MVRYRCQCVLRSREAGVDAESRARSGRTVRRRVTVLGDFWLATGIPSLVADDCTYLR